MSKKKSKPNTFSAEWAKAKKLCRLNMEDIRKAKALGFKPKSLIKNIPAKSETWKLPVKEWIREKYEEKHGKKECKNRKAICIKNQVQISGDEDVEPIKNNDFLEDIEESEDFSKEKFSYESPDELPF